METIHSNMKFFLHLFVMKFYEKKTKLQIKIPFHDTSMNSQNMQTKQFNGLVIIPMHMK